MNTDRERKARMVAKRRAEGRCTKCGRERDNPTRVCCANCRLRYRQRDAERRMPTHGPPHCECGRGRKVSVGGQPAEMASCVQCQRLDGAGSATFGMIQALRSVDGGMTLDALSMELGMVPNSVAQLGNRRVRRGLLTKKFAEVRLDALKGGMSVVSVYYLARVP